MKLEVDSYLLDISFWVFHLWLLLWACSHRPLKPNTWIKRMTWKNHWSFKFLVNTVAFPFLICPVFLQVRWVKFQKIQQEKWDDCTKETGSSSTGRFINLNGRRETWRQVVGQGWTEEKQPTCPSFGMARVCKFLMVWLMLVWIIVTLKGEEQVTNKSYINSCGRKLRN